MILGSNLSCTCNAVRLHNTYCCMLPWPKTDLHLEAVSGCEKGLETRGSQERRDIVIFCHMWRNRSKVQTSSGPLVTIISSVTCCTVGDFLLYQLTSKAKSSFPTSVANIFYILRKNKFSSRCQGRWAGKKIEICDTKRGFFAKTSDVCTETHARIFRNQVLAFKFKIRTVYFSPFSW